MVGGSDLLLTLKLLIHGCAIVAIGGVFMTLRPFSSRWNRVLRDAEVELIKLDFVPYEKHRDNCRGCYDTWAHNLRCHARGLQQIDVPFHCHVE